jgi:2-phosphosulfolactate phosphatase
VSAADPRSTTPFDQHGYAARFDWGEDGLRRVAPGAGAIVVIDVLRFTSAVSVATSRGVEVLPFRWRDERAPEHAREHGARLTESISPVDMLDLEPGDRIVLPSPNGSALSFGARDHAPEAAVIAGCLRNAGAVAHAVLATEVGHVAVVAAGERWPGSAGALRPALEDLLGAGAVLSGLPAEALSPEARAAVAVFGGVDDLTATLLDCASGRELVARGWRDDVLAAAELDADVAVPTLVGPAFVAR